MMYTFLVFALPLAYGFATLDYPCWEVPEDPVCEEPYGLLCPGSTDFYTGCQSTVGFCVESVKPGSSDNDGNPCPNNCPVEYYCDYTKDEIWCPDAPVNGCEGPGYCMEPARDNIGRVCNTMCPPICNADYGEVYCPGSVDPYTGCESPGYCAWPYQTDCPAVCDVTCDYNNGEVMCENGYDENGCNLGAYCMEPTKDNWGGNCYASCPPVCNADYGEVYCPGSVDSYSGCEMPGHCAYAWDPNCPAVCDVTCDYYNGERYCDNGVDENGCWMGRYCSPFDVPCLDLTATA